MGSDDSRWSWPDALDALAAAPEHHRLLLENEHVRVLETLIPAGETTAIHTHRWANVQYVVSGTDFVRRDDKGTVLVDSRADGTSPRPGAVHWSGPLPPHLIENVGDADLTVIMVELKT